MKSPASGAHHAFTLIELLVVIAIISLLAAILFPVFGQARSSARQTVCRSNLKQLGLGMLQYAQDYDEYFPCGNGGTISTTMGLGWAGQLQPYVKNTQIFHCPEDNGRPGVGITGANIYCSYRYNYSLLRDPVLGNTFAGIKTIAAYTATARTVLFYETTADMFVLTDSEIMSPVGNGRRVVSTLVYYPANSIMKPGSGWMGSLDPEPMARHRDGSNILAADGHVKWYQPDQISYGYRAINTTDAEANNGQYAEGTEYSGPGQHQMTMSYR